MEIPKQKWHLPPPEKYDNAINNKKITMYRYNTQNRNKKSVAKNIHPKINKNFPHNKKKVFSVAKTYKRGVSDDETDKNTISDNSGSGHRNTENKNALKSPQNEKKY